MLIEVDIIVLAPLMVLVGIVGSFVGEYLAYRRCRGQGHYGVGETEDGSDD